MNDPEPIQPPRLIVLNAAPPESQVVAHVDAGGAMLLIHPPREKVNRVCVLLSLVQLEVLAAEIRDRQRILKLAAGEG